MDHAEFNRRLEACLGQGFNTWDDYKERDVTELFREVWPSLSLHLDDFYHNSEPEFLIQDEIKHISRLSKLSQARLKRALNS
jgi:hypothetical protein